MTRKSVFLDTSFLIASQLKNHKFFMQTQNLRGIFFEKNYNLCIHSIVMDEFWYVLIGIWKSEFGNKNNKKLYNELIKATQNVLSFENIIVLESNLNKQDIMDVVESMYRYKLRPRDTIIVNIMKKEKIKYIASFDYDFRKIPGINVLS